MEPEISVQIPVRNGGEEFGQALLSLAGQRTDGIPWELVIIDDGSTVPVEKEYDLSFPGHVKVKVLRREGQGNRPIARNMGWQAASADISFLSDGDILFPEDILLKHILAHRTRLADVVMGARVNAWMEDASPWQKWFDTRAMGGKPAGPFPPRYFITGNISLRTALLEAAGGFDGRIDHYGGEDTEFGFRLARIKAGLYWDPELEVYHLDRVTAREHSRKMVEYGGTGLRYTLKKIPEARGMLGTDWVGPVFSKPANPSRMIMRMLVRITLIPAVYRTVLRWMERFGRPSFLFTYLSVGGCLMGYRGRNFE